MRLFVTICLFNFANAGLFGLFGKKEPVKVTSPDTGELGANIENGNLGRGIGPRGRSLGGDGGLEVVIPRNGQDEERVKTTTSPPRFTTQRTTTTRVPVTRFQPSEEAHRPSADGCPRSVDAFTPGPSFSLLFEGSKVYQLQGQRISSVSQLSTMFPGGPKSVKAAVYDQDKELVLLFEERQVYGFKKTFSPSVFQLDSTYPKTLPESIAFTPNAAIRWHDGHQMVLSSGGKFALYDEYWNKSLMTGRTMRYFEGLPDKVRGISEWHGDTSDVFTPSLVVQYDKTIKGVKGEGVSLQQYLHC